MRYKYRITKYNPTYRNEEGVFQCDDWTSISDIGRTYNGKVFSKPDYEAVEEAYLFSIESMLTEASIQTLTLKSSENHRDFKLPEFVVNNASLSINQCVDFARLCLREKVWGILSMPRLAYVHFGYDYYMYIGVPVACKRSILAISEKGLYVEAFRSPYLRG